MTVRICVTCGIEHPDEPEPPRACAIRTDERQFVPAGGQRWTTLAEPAEAGRRVRPQGPEPDLATRTVEPRFAIGHRGPLVRTVAGNLR